MAYKERVHVVKEQVKRFKRAIRYTVRLVPIAVIMAAITWFFLLRSPGGQTNTSGSTNTPDTTPQTTASTTTPTVQPEPKITDNANLAQPTTDDSKAEQGKLPQTGPADTLEIFAITATAGTLFWHWRLRRARQHNS